MNNCVCGFILCLLSWCNANAQTINEPVNNKEWIRPYKPFRIVGNIYYVGTYDLASYLIVTNKGNILINTGLESSLPLIKHNIEDLGFHYKDIKILLTNQVHYDHVGAMAAIKKETGAKFYVDAADADVLKSGGRTDYELNHLGTSFQSIIPNKLLKNNDTIKLGDTKITMLHHPGHTKGSCSFMLNVDDATKSYKALIANIPTIIIDRKFQDVTDYPTIQQDYVYTIDAMKKLQFDIWLAAHASQFSLHTKHKESDAYNPEAFKDIKGYNNVLDEAEKAYQEKVNQK